MITISKARMAELRDKMDFVQWLSRSFREFQQYTTIEGIEYVVFGYNGYIEEYAVVTFVGGGIAVRNCRGNSLTAIYRSIGQLLDGGYYDEVESYRYRLEHSEDYEVEKDA